MLSYLPLTLVSHHTASHKHCKLISETATEVTEGIQCSHVGEQPPLLLYGGVGGDMCIQMSEEGKKATCAYGHMETCV